MLENKQKNSKYICIKFKVLIVLLGIYLSDFITDIDINTLTVS